MLNDLALRIGKYLHENWCKFCILKILMILVSLSILIISIIYTVFFYKKHNDYYIYHHHYLIRPNQSTFRSHLDICCQYFSVLTEEDENTINGNDTLMVGLALLFSFFGVTILGVWAIFLQMKGKFGTYVTSTISNMLVSQFSLMRTVIKYGDNCIECSHLQLLVVKPELYPYIGLFVFLLGSAVIAIYFKANFERNPWLNYVWFFVLAILLVVWGVCTILTAMNSPLGILLLINLFFDILCTCESYYEYELQKNEEEEEKSCFSSLCDCKCPC